MPLGEALRGVRHRSRNQQTYNKPTTNGSVDTEADWKAGQAVEPCNGIQAAIAAGEADIRDIRSVVTLGRAVALLLRGDGFMVLSRAEDSGATIVEEARHCACRLPSAAAVARGRCRVNVMAVS